MQDRLRATVILDDDGPDEIRVVAGLDVAYAPDSDHAAAAVVLLDAESGDVVESATAFTRVDFPYLPGLFAFREVPPLVAALREVKAVPDLLVCDGYGLAHPRRFGLACHLGVLTGLPSIGVGKTAFIGEHPPVGAERGDWAPLTDQGEVIGRVLRTRSGVKPVFVSVGHRIGLDRAGAQVLRLCRQFRLPETVRAADHLCREVLKARSVST
jgi:deoxyribonuclease V